MRETISKGKTAIAESSNGSLNPKQIAITTMMMNNRLKKVLPVIASNCTMVLPIMLVGSITAIFIHYLLKII